MYQINKHIKSDTQKLSNIYTYLPSEDILNYYVLDNAVLRDLL